MEWVAVALMVSTSAFLFGVRDGRRSVTHEAPGYRLRMMDDSPQTGYCSAYKACPNYRKKVCRDGTA